MRADCIAAGSSELAGAQGDAHRANVLTPSRPTTNEPSRLLRSSALCIHALARKARTGENRADVGGGNSWTASRCTREDTHDTDPHPTPRHRTLGHSDTDTNLNTEHGAAGAGPARTHMHTHKTADHAPGRCHGPSPPPILRAHATQHGTNPPNSRAQAARTPLLPRAAAQSLPLWARGDAAAAAAHRHPGRSGASGSRPALASAIDLAMRVT